MMYYVFFHEYKWSFRMYKYLFWLTAAITWRHRWQLLQFLRYSVFVTKLNYLKNNSGQKNMSPRVARFVMSLVQSVREPLFLLVISQVSPHWVNVIFGSSSWLKQTLVSVWAKLLFLQENKKETKSFFFFFHVSHQTTNICYFLQKQRFPTTSSTSVYLLVT